MNGTQVGASAWVENPRVYRVGEGVLKSGRNILVIRVLKTKPDGGFLAKPEVLRLMLGDRTAVPLAGQWKGQLSVDARPPHPLEIALPPSSDIGQQIVEIGEIRIPFRMNQIRQQKS